MRGPIPPAMDDLATALLVALILVLAYFGYKHWKKGGPGSKGGFVGLPLNAWPGPSMTFPKGQVWPYPSYY